MVSSTLTKMSIIFFLDTDKNEYYFFFFLFFLLAMSEFIHMSGSGNPYWSGISYPLFSRCSDRLRT